MAASEEEDGDENMTDDNHNILEYSSSSMNAVLCSFLHAIGSVASHEERVSAVVSVWSRLSHLSLPASDEDNTLYLSFVCLLEHTARVVLHAGWLQAAEEPRRALTAAVRRCGSLPPAASLAGSRLVFLLRRFAALATLCDRPWQHETLCLLMRRQPVTDQQVVEFCCEEGPLVLWQRVQVLCDSKCDDLALTLVSQCNSCLESSVCFRALCSVSMCHQLNDLELVLLLRCKQKQQIISKLSVMQDGPAVMLLKRLAFVSEEQRCWRGCHKLAHLAADVFLPRAITASTSPYITELSMSWLGLHRKDCLTLEQFEGKVRRLLAFRALSCGCPSHLPCLAPLIAEHYGESARALAIELCVLALTRLTNRLRQCGDGAWRPTPADPDTEGCLTRALLAAGFVSLAAVTSSVWLVRRECLLSAFSLLPSASLLEQMFPGEALLEEERFAACSDSLVRQLRGDGDVQRADYDVLGGSCVAAVQGLGVPAHLCSDLLVVLSASRWKRLSWGYSGSAALLALCSSYLQNPGAVAGVATDLKHARLPREQLVSTPEPTDQFAGIEKGYERYLRGVRQSRATSNSPTNTNSAVSSDDMQNQSSKGRRSLTGSCAAVSGDKLEVSYTSETSIEDTKSKIRTRRRRRTEKRVQSEPSEDRSKSFCPVQGKRVTSNECRSDPLRGSGKNDSAASVWADKLKHLKDVMARRISAPKTAPSPVSTTSSDSPRSSSSAGSLSVSPSPPRPGVPSADLSKSVSCISSVPSVVSACSGTPELSTGVSSADKPLSFSSVSLPSVVSACSVTLDLSSSVRDALAVLRSSASPCSPLKHAAPVSSALIGCLSPTASSVALSQKREHTAVSWSSAVAGKHDLLVQLPKCMSVRPLPPEPAHHLVYPVHVTGGGGTSLADTSQSVSSMLSSTSVVTAPPTVSSRSAQTTVSHSRPPVSANRNKRPRTSVDNGQTSVDTPALSQRSSISVQEVLRRVRQESSAPVSTPLRLTQLLNTPVSDTPSSPDVSLADRPSSTILNQLLEAGPPSEAAVPPSALSQLLDTPASASGEEETITLYRSQDTASVPHVVAPRPPHLPEVKQVVIPAVLQQQQQQQQQQMSSLLPQAGDHLPALSTQQQLLGRGGAETQVGSQLSQILSRPLDSSRHMKSSRQLASLLTSGVSTPRRAAAPSCVSAASQTSSDLSAADEGLVGRIADYLMRSSSMSTSSASTSTTSTAVLASGVAADSASTSTVLTPARGGSTSAPQLVMTSRPLVSRAVSVSAATVCSSQPATVATARPSVASSTTGGPATQPVLHAGQVLVLNNQQKVLPQNIMLHGQQYTLVTRNSQMIYLPSRLMQVQQQQQAPKPVRAAVSSADSASSGGSASFSQQCQQPPVSAAGVVSSTTLEQLREFESVLEAVSTRGATPVATASASAGELDSLVGAELMAMTRSSAQTTSTATTSAPSLQLDVKMCCSPSPATSTPVVTSVAGAVSAASPRVRHVRNASTSISQPLTGAITAIASHKLSGQRAAGSGLPVPAPTAFKAKPLMSGSLVKTSPVKQELEDDETRQRIAAILQQYQQDLACNPTPTPAPRNRKNPPVYTSRGGGAATAALPGSSANAASTLDSAKTKKKCSPVKRNESTGGETSGSVSESASPVANDVSPSLERSVSDTSVSTQTVASQPATPASQPFRTLRVVRLVTPPSHQVLSSTPATTSSVQQSPLESSDSLLPPFHTLAPTESAPGTPPSGWPCAVKQPLEEQLFPGLMKEEPVDDLTSPPPAALSADSPSVTASSASAVSAANSIKLAESSPPLSAPSNGETSTDNVAEDVHIQQASFFTEQLQSCLSTGRQLSPQQQRHASDLPSSHQFLLEAGSDSLASAGSEGSGPPTPLLSQSSVHVITGVVSATAGVMADQSSGTPAGEPPTDIDPLIYHVRVDCRGPESWGQCCGVVCLLDRLGAMCFELQSSSDKHQKLEPESLLNEKAATSALVRSSSCDSGLDLTTVSMASDWSAGRRRRKRVCLSALRLYRHRWKRVSYSSSDQEYDHSVAARRQKRACRRRVVPVDFSDDERVGVECSSSGLLRAPPAHGNGAGSGQRLISSSSTSRVCRRRRRRRGQGRLGATSRALRPRRCQGGASCSNPYCSCNNRGGQH